MSNYDINLKLFNISRIQRRTYNSLIEELDYYIYMLFIFIFCCCKKEVETHLQNIGFIYIQITLHKVIYYLSEINQFSIHKFLFGIEKNIAHQQ